MQIPQFIEQYMQHLQGHVAELHFQVGQVQKAANSTHKSMGEYVQQFTTSQDPVFYVQGSILQNLIDRSAEMTTSFNELFSANVLMRPFVFFKHLNMSIAKETLASFQFGVYFSIETTIYLLVGLFFGYILYLTLTKLFKRGRSCQKTSNGAM